LQIDIMIRSLRSMLVAVGECEADGNGLPYAQFAALDVQ